MNRYESRAQDQRKAGMRSSVSLWTAGVAFLIVVLMIMGMRDGAPRDYFYKLAGGGAVVLLVLRQLVRRLKAKVPRAARPDPKSTLKLS